MRLSSRLSDKSKNNGEIESFIDWERYTVSPEEEAEDLQLISAGDFIEIQIGTIMQPFYSTVTLSAPFFQLYNIYLRNNSSKVFPLLFFHSTHPLVLPPRTKSDAPLGVRKDTILVR